ncbi:MAG: NAD-dependent epimerase/dehydratase family protein [Alphaproteobacteria bacterium]|nr:NAD-dependent epimerase/dehydratase family protein [Alphaproteobacteria bacterium]
MAIETDRVFVTGASGFVGSAVARALAEQGYAITALVRSSSSRANLGDFPCRIVEGDARDPEAVRHAMKDARYVFHVAADYRLWAPDPEEIMRNNVSSTKAVMEAALEVGAERVVYTSSVATLKPDPDGPANETAAARPDETVGAYKRSKVAAERLVEAMVGERGLPAVIVNPSTPIGPHDVRPTPTGRVVVEAALGHMPAYVDSGLNVVHVDDVAAGHLAALEHGRIGERYILGGQDVTLRDLLESIGRLTGRNMPLFGLPRAPLFPLAWANEALARFRGKEPFLNLDTLRMARHNMFYSSAKAAAELGYRARAYHVALADALDWFRSVGMIH